MPVGFIFDLDGVLADTNRLQFRAWRHIAQLENVPFKPEYETAFLGLPRHQCLDLLLDGKPTSEAHRAYLMALKDAHYLQLVNQLSAQDVSAGVVTFLSRAQAMGIRLGLASSSKRAREVCSRLNLLDYFSALGDGHTVPNHKPAPDIFMWVARQLDVAPQQCVVFEDALAGVRGARAGGFWVIGLGGDGSQVSEAHRVYPSLAHITPEECLPPL